MKRPGSILLLLPLLAAATASGADEFRHPAEVLAGVWRLPVFYSPEEEPGGTPELTVRSGEDTIRVLMEPLPRLGGGPRFGVVVEEPLLAEKPGGTVELELAVGGEVIHRGSIPILLRLPGRELLSAEETGAVLWELDGAGGLLPEDTLGSGEVIEECLLLGDGDLPVVAAVTGSGDLVVWSGPRRPVETLRVPLGSRPSATARGRTAGEGFFGLIDGRIVRVGIDRGRPASEVIVTARGIPTSLAVGDGDGDGRTDLMATVLEMDRSVLVIWAGGEDGSFRAAEPRVIPLPGTGRTVLFADLAGRGEPGPILLLHGPDVGLSGVSSWTLAGGDSLSVVDLPGMAGKSVHRLVGGDWNGDGREDLGVVAGAAEARLELYLLDPGGRRGRVVCLIPLAGPEVDVIATDIDGNGADDVVVAEGVFRIWLSDGTGRMSALAGPPAGAPTRLAPGPIR